MIHIELHMYNIYIYLYVYLKKKTYLNYNIYICVQYFRGFDLLQRNSASEVEDHYPQPCRAGPGRRPAETVYIYIYPVVSQHRM